MLLGRYIQKGVWVANYVVLWPLLRIFYSFTIVVSDESQRVRAPVIIAANHRAKIDPWVVAVALPFRVFVRILPIRYVGATTYRSHILNAIDYIGLIPLVHYFYGVLRIPSGRGKRAKIKPFITAIENSDSIGIFPEGAIRKGRRIGTIKDGIAMIQKTTGVSILPITVRYGKRLMFRRRCVIYIGEPIAPKRSNSIDKIKEQVSEALAY